MKQRTASRLALGAWVLTNALSAVGVVLYAMTLSTPSALYDPFYRIFLAVMALAFSTVGALIASRHRANPIGWIMIASGLLFGIHMLAQQYAIYVLLAGHDALPAGVLAAWVDSWIWVPGWIPPLTFMLLLFPDGRVPSRRWRPVAWLSALAIALAAVAAALRPGRLDNFPSFRNPFGASWLRSFDLEAFAMILAMVVIVASAVSLVLRARRAGTEERRQIKWLAYAAALVALAVAVNVSAILAGVPENSPAYDLIWYPIFLAFGAVPISVGIAILKYRLFAIDVVIRKTVVFAVVAAFITLVYVAVVVGIGTLVAGSRSSGLVTFVAAAVIAIAFQPVRERARHFANRLIYGKRATPYEVLSEFSRRMGGAYATEDILPRMARILGEGTGARRSDVWLRLGSEVRRVASWPNPREGREAPVSLQLDNGQLPEFPGATRAAAVKHQGELLGALSLVKPPAEPLTPDEDKLVADLASQAGLVLRNVRLTSELRARLDEISRQAEELQASRKRLVAAQDAERRRLERNLHDGAQQQLVALAIRLRLARALAKRDPDKADETLGQLEAEAQEALENLRDLARGIYPPLLQDQGLAAALEAQARKSPVPVTVEADSLSRYPQEAEAAVYFCCLEALQNVAKYSGASRAVVRVSSEDGELDFSVEDDGRGFDPETTPKGSGLQNMTDRVAALGGALEVRSRPGEGTTVTGRVPVRELERV